MEHVTVLQREAVDALALTPDAVVVDATLGSGGHTRAILEKLDASGTLIAFDADPKAITEFRESEYDTDATVHLVNQNFRELDTVLEELQIQSVDAVLADLGWRIEQFTEGERGFSFQFDAPLLMTYGDPETYPFTARDIVNDWSEESIANVIKGYGEERYARRIAHAIVDARATTPIENSKQLTDIITTSVPRRYALGKVHPATRTFQALRIAVNDELATIEAFIEHAIAHLAPGGRLALITFHSLEDRIVKHTFRSYAADGKGTIITKKPLTATAEEQKINPRARSAKLRIFQTYDSTKNSTL